MKKYKVVGYESVMYYVYVNAINKSDAYNKAMDVHVEDWQQQDTTGLWDNGGFKINKKEIKEIKNAEEKYRRQEASTIKHV